jgi:putative phage-type endonuclease
MTATVILESDATREEWLAARRLGVTGTDISAILSANPWTTPLDVWREKTGRGTEVRMNDAMRRGTDLEPTIVKWAHRHLEEAYGGRWWIEYDDLPLLVAHPDRPLLLGSMDALAHSKDGTWLIEAKTGKHSDLLSEVPPHYVAQAQWYLGVCGLDRGLLAAFAAMDEGYHPLDADPEWFTAATGYAEQWWQRHVVADEPPPADPDRDAAAIAAMRTPDPELAAELDPGVAMELLRAHQARKAADEAYKAAEAAVKAALGDATTATLDGSVIATWTRTTSRRLDQRRLKADHPDLVADYLTETTSDRFLTKQRKGA